jgi:K+-sensing histidine kinase KdpD
VTDGIKPNGGRQSPARSGAPSRPARRWSVPVDSIWFQYTIAIGVVLAVTLVAFLFEPRIGGPHAAALIYLLAVVVLGSSVRRGPTLVAATMSALLWDFFMLKPFRTREKSLLTIRF